MNSSDNDTAQSSPSDSPDSDSPKRRPWGLIGIAALVFLGIYFATRPGDGGPDGLAERPYQVPTPPEPPMERLDDPNADGWPTEALAEQAKQQLKSLGKLVLHPEKLDRKALRKYVSDDFAFHSQAE